jgi:hypothetical protein
VPPYHGYGSPEDSLGSVYSLNPKPPKVDMKKMFKQDMHVLRFEAQLVSSEPDDETRQFIVSFYCGDDTIQVYEVCDKNSGRIGGRFMERKKQTNPVTQRNYIERDFVLGAIVFLGGFKFRLLKADEYTEKYMEDNSQTFPHASIEHVLQKLVKGAKKFNGNLQDYAVHLIKMLDRNDDGFVDVEEFAQGLETLNVFVTVPEQHTLLRRFDINGDGKISMEEFYNTLAALF